jgi:hypothetical protein
VKRLEDSYLAGKYQGNCQGITVKTHHIRLITERNIFQINPSKSIKSRSHHCIDIPLPIANMRFSILPAVALAIYNGLAVANPVP